MKTSLRSIATLCVAFLCQSGWAQDAPPLKVMSFNIRYGLAKDGDNHWKHRKQHVVTSIKKFNPDLLGTQETLKFQAEFLQSNLPDFDYVGRSRQADDDDGEQTAIFYRRERYERLGDGHFWLSETPDSIGSKSWDSSLPRMASWVKLRDRKSNLQLYFLNTHFDHRGSEARRQSAIVIRKWAEKLGNANIIVTGDFNAAENSPPYEQLVSKSPLSDSYRALHKERGKEEGTFNGWKPQFGGSRIDWILFSPQLKATSATICHDSYNGKFPSDHCPVTAVLEQIQN